MPDAAGPWQSTICWSPAVSTLLHSIPVDDAGTSIVALSGRVTRACGTCCTQKKHTSCTGMVVATPVAVGVGVSPVEVATGISSVGVISTSVGTTVAAAVGVLVAGVPQAVLMTTRINATNRSIRGLFFISLSL
jgi:hypothetical protein